MGVFDKKISPLALVGYEMIIANSALRVSLATAWQLRRLSKISPFSFRKTVLFDHHRSNTFKIP